MPSIYCICDLQLHLPLSQPQHERQSRSSGQRGRSSASARCSVPLEVPRHLPTLRQPARLLNTPICLS